MSLESQTAPLAGSHSDQEHHVLPVRTYLVIFAILMVLLFLTVAVAFINLGPFNIVVAMTIAIVKATLVVLYFMHVKYSSRLTQVYVVAAFLWLGIMFVFTFADYSTREWTPNSRGWTDDVRQTRETGGVPVRHGTE
jgi:cytochrome c oxidase subunit 4